MCMLRAPPQSGMSSDILPEKVAVNKQFPVRIWEEEKAGISELAGEYSESSSSEAFALWCSPISVSTSMMMRQWLNLLKSAHLHMNL